MGELRTDRHVWREDVAADRALSPTARLVGMTLESKWINSETGTAWPAVETIAEAVGFKVRAVQYALRSLERAGYMAITVRRGRGRSNIYRLTLPAEDGGEVVTLTPQPSERRVARPGKPATVSRITPREKVQLRARKGATSCTPYTEHPKEHSNAPRVRCVRIDRDGHAAEAWDRWLTARGSPPLEAFAGCDRGSFFVPETMPPEGDDAIGLRRCEQWLAAYPVTGTECLGNTCDLRVITSNITESGNQERNNGPNIRNVSVAGDRRGSVLLALGGSCD